MGELTTLAMARIEALSAGLPQRAAPELHGPTVG